MIRLFLCLCILLFSTGIFAQQRSTTLISVPGNGGSSESHTVTIPTEDAPFLAISLRWDDSAHHYELRFSEDERSWSPWELVIPDSHRAPDQSWRSALTYTDVTTRYVQIRQVTGSTSAKVALHIFNPGPDQPTPFHLNNAAAGSSNCACPLPEVEERLDWCPAGTCPEITNPVFTEVTHLIVHHSAGTNSSSNWAGVVRSIWDFHVNTNGWDDVGYNYLIDADGIIYVGRGNDVRGAHFCGNNTGTMGVCVLGNFQTVDPTAAARDALVELLAWKACDKDLDPEGAGFHASSGFSLDRISPHRAGCATSCPGDLFAPTFPDLRTEVADFILSCAPASIPNTTLFDASEW
ncbi:MAG: N-acetylmuramoyl-L-alanine amidase, partial [Bacteroidota bacterium]